MTHANQALTHQLLEWISDRPRTYAETLDAWHSTCPRLSIWEDACIEGLIDHDKVRDIVRPSAKGRDLLEHVGSGRRKDMGATQS